MNTYQMDEKDYKEFLEWLGEPDAKKYRRYMAYSSFFSKLASMLDKLSLPSAWANARMFYYVLESARYMPGMREATIRRMRGGPEVEKEIEEYNLLVQSMTEERIKKRAAEAARSINTAR